MRYDPEAQVVLLDAAGRAHGAIIKPMELEHQELFDQWLAWGSAQVIDVTFRHWPDVIGQAQDEESGVMGFACEAADDLQGLIALRIPLSARDSLRVEYLETAPWNRQLPSAGGAPRFRGVGTQLLCQAIALSDNLGMAGSIELSSLDESSDKFYDKIRMEIAGIDAYQQAIYWFGAQEAQEFYRRNREE